MDNDEQMRLNLLATVALGIFTKEQVVVIEHIARYQAATVLMEAVTKAVEMAEAEGQGEEISEFIRNIARDTAPD